jgi:hypothetical protein
MYIDLLTALALVLVIEGALYALFPAGMLRMMETARELPPPALRAGGLVAAVVGVLLVWLLRG